MGETFRALALACAREGFTPKKNWKFIFLKFVYLCCEKTIDIYHVDNFSDNSNFEYNYLCPLGAWNGVYAIRDDLWCQLITLKEFNLWNNNNRYTCLLVGLFRVIGYGLTPMSTGWFCAIWLTLCGVNPMPVNARASTSMVSPHNPFWGIGFVTLRDGRNLAQISRMTPA